MEQIQRNRRSGKLSEQQAKLVKYLIQGMSITAAALKAGYTEKSPGQAGYQALKTIRLKVPEIMEKQGLSDKKLIKNYLKPALEAANTRRVVHVYSEADVEGQLKTEEVVEEQKEPAWDARLKALDMAFKLRGSYAPTEVEHTGNIIHEITELEKRKALGSVEKIKTLEVIDVTPIESLEEASARD